MATGRHPPPPRVAGPAEAQLVVKRRLRLICVRWLPDGVETENTVQDGRSGVPLQSGQTLPGQRIRTGMCGQRHGRTFTCSAVKTLSARRARFAAPRPCPLASGGGGHSCKPLTSWRNPLHAGSAAARVLEIRAKFAAGREAALPADNGGATALHDRVERRWSGFPRKRGIQYSATSGIGGIARTFAGDETEVIPTEQKPL
jgi:hypothetical protein